MSKVLTLFLLMSVIATADDLDRFIDNKIHEGLEKIGSSIQSLIPGEGDTEVSVSEQDNYDIKYSILAVRPLYINPYSNFSSDHLYFMQARLSNHEPFANGDERTVLNTGLGFRALINDDNAIVGINFFHDYEFDEAHQRGSLGIEYLTSNFQIFANLYDRLSERVNYTIGAQNVMEEVVDGYDFSVVGQLPFLPWGSIIYTGYSWDNTGSDLEGNRLSIEANIISSLMLEYGKNDIDNSSDDEDFYKLTFKWPSNHLTPTIFTHTVTDYAFSNKNMKNKMLNKVRRTNNIITERRTGGVVIARGT